MRVRVIESPFGSTTDVYIFEETPDGRISVAKPMVLEMMQLGPNEAVAEPSLRLWGRNGPRLLDAIAKGLDEAQIRPGSAITAEARAEATIAALRAHLADLQEMLGIAGPKKVNA